VTRVLFLQDNGINESLALTEVSAVVRAAGHETHLLLGDEEADLAAAVADFAPGLVVIPCPVAGHLRALADARLAKDASPGCVVVLTGTYASLHPDVALATAVNAVVVGEAEGAIRELADRVGAGARWEDVRNLGFARDGELHRNPLRPLVDLDALPPPDRDLYYRYPFVGALPWKKFATGRGCMHDCGFCWNASLRDLYAGETFVRRKSPGAAVQEIVRVAGRYPLNRVHFSDDLFTVHPSWLEEFAPLYRARVGVPFTCNSSVPLVTDRTVDALAAAGCCGVAIGVETGNEELRARILGKAVTNAEIAGAARRIKDRGLELITYNMVGSPGETVDDVLSTVRLNGDIGVDRVRVNLAIPLPHTRFEETAFSLGFLDERGAATRLDGLVNADVVTGPPADRTTLVNLYLLFRLAVHVPAARPLVARLARAGDLRPLHVFRLWGIYEEKRITGLRWRDGLRYFRHVGDPRKRTANYVTLP